MASIKKLKKDINYVLGDLIGMASEIEHKNEKTIIDKKNALEDEIFDVYDDLISRVNTKDVENKKQHLKEVANNLEERGRIILNKIKEF